MHHPSGTSKTGASLRYTWCKYWKISVPFAVMYLWLWNTFVNPFVGPNTPNNVKGPKKPQSPKKCTFYNINKYFIGWTIFLIIINNFLAGGL